MNKRELRKIEIMTLSQAQMEMAATADIDFLIAVQASDDPDLLILNIFEIEDIAKGIASPSVRTFMSKDDYITENLGRTGGRWFTGRLRSLLDIRRSGRRPCAFIDRASKVMIEKRFGEIKDMKYWYRELSRWQDSVLARKLTDRREKELSHTRKMMDQVPALPDRFEEWLYEDALSEFHYLIYKPERKRHIKGFCSCCKKDMVLDTKEQKIRRGNTVSCPECGRKMILMPQSAGLNGRNEDPYSRYYNNKWICLFQKTETGFLARYFEAGILYSWDKSDLHRESEFWNQELCRVFYTDEGSESFEYAVYKQFGDPQWCPDTGKINCAIAMVYTDNLPDVFQGTIYQYCSLDLLQKLYAGKMIPVWHFMKDYPGHKYYEFLVKTGMTNILMSLLNHTGCFDRNVLNHNGRTPEEILNVPKSMLKGIISSNLTMKELGLVQQCVIDGIAPDLEDIALWASWFYNGKYEIKMVNAFHWRTSLHHFIGYLQKQTALYPIKYPSIKESDVFSDWKDYIGWCTEIGYDLSDRYYLLPPDLKSAHDRVYREYKENRDKIEAEKKRRLAREIEKICAAAIRGKGFEMRTDDLMIKVPKSADEIRSEGNILHHCVGSYIERVARGETMILFVRRVSAPEIPFYTLEWQKDHVVQCRGRKNEGMTEDVKAFVGAFERMMLDRTA